MNMVNKELVNTFSYTTINKDRYGIMSVKINGRDYTKYGTYQAVTVVGNLYKYLDPSTNSYKNLLTIGVSIQHPGDIMINKEEAYENAMIKSLIDPDIVLKTRGKFRRFTFVEIAKTYIDSLELKFVKTAEEIKEDNNEKLDYYDNYYLDYRAEFLNKFPKIK